MEQIQELESARLRLRPWRDTDLAEFAAMCADPQVMRYFPKSLSRLESASVIGRFRGHFAEHGYGFWALERKATGAFIGFTGLSQIGFKAPFGPAVEIGWRLSRDAWGHGFATEAATAVLDLAFGELGMPELVSFTTVGNVRSRAVMARLGMRHDPVDDFEHPSLPVGHPLRTHVLYRLAPTDRPPKSA